ncbi:hypothetical protein F7725_013578 [Dissostichus mawsoni]|uniref:Uncharacterized protein n=1 Tax=Dissostichus mawsoni TaxID=36200 RepID=A0A7J5Y6I4_DISMA|nr:hypothetical protein F7725_013578 [Dissostichus mawsoni]
MFNGLLPAVEYGAEPEASPLHVVTFPSPLPPPLPRPPSTPDTAAGPPEGRGAGTVEAERSPATTREMKSQLHRGSGPFALREERVLPLQEMQAEDNRIRVSAGNGAGEVG